MPLAVARTNIWDALSPPRSMQFGAFTQRGVGITRCSWEEPDLPRVLHKVAEFRPKHLLSAYLTISLSEYTTLRLHVDKRNGSSSIVIAFGDFTGGELWIEREGRAFHLGNHPPPESCSTDEEKLLCGDKLPVRHQFQVLYPSRRHCIFPVEGRRVSAVFYVLGRVGALTVEHWGALAELGFPTHSFAESTLVHLFVASLQSKSDQVLLKKLDHILYKSTRLPAIKGRSPLEVASLKLMSSLETSQKICPACQMESGTNVDHPRVHSWEFQGVQHPICGYCQDRR
eukprot:533992-Amphidinium_carterae.2